MSETNKNKKSLPGMIHDDRPLPQAPDAEIAVLGSILLEPNPLMENAIEFLGIAYTSTKKKGGNSTPPVFYNPKNQRIYTALCQMYTDEQGIDIITLCNLLIKENALEYVGGELYLRELIDSVATTANFEAWCKIVKNYSTLRNLITTCEIVKDKCYEKESNVSALIDEIEQEVLKAGQNQQKSDIIALKELLKNTDHEDSATRYLFSLMKKEQSVAGIPTGFPDLDKLITGLKPGEMFVLAARPSIGKTSFALNMMVNVAMNTANPAPVGFFSLEMTARQLAVRLICTEVGFSERDFYEGNIKSTTKLSAAATNLAKAPIFIDPTPSLRIHELRSKARRMKTQHDIKAIFIDYLQLMKAETKNDSRQEEVAAISSGIKALAKELNVPIVVLAQLNREVEKSATGTPKLSHLRESGSIEQDADIVAFLHRERDEQKEISPEVLANGLDADLIIEKNRNGQTGKVPLVFFPRLTLFRNRTRIAEEDVPR